MTTYIVLANFTDQGIRNIKDTTKRADEREISLVRMLPPLCGATSHWISPRG
jgi:hypothetical protein